jgi:hypothetical protein
LAAPDDLLPDATMTIAPPIRITIADHHEVVGIGLSAPSHE